jgi:hypothetical protein
VKLSKDERERLHELTSAGTALARMLNRARILLKADVGDLPKEKRLLRLRDRQMLEASTATVQRVRERYCTQGLDAALERSVPNPVSLFWRRAPFDGSSLPPFAK